MAWLIAAIIVVVTLIFLAGFRKSALSILVVGLLGGYGIYQHGQRAQHQAQSKIASSEIQVESIALNQTLDGSYDLLGRIKNNSTYRLDGIRVIVTLRDCKGNDRTSCRTIGEAATSVPVTIPPEQARDFVASLYFGGDPIRVKGTLVWDYEITSTTARRQ